jgi:hypothetical protein
MQKPDPVYVAAEDYVWFQQDGSQSTLHARVGAPYRAEHGCWACPAELVGLDGRYPDVMGESSMQALSLAVRLVATRLGHLLERGEHLVHPAEPALRLSSEHLANTFGVFGASPAG